MLQTLFGPHLNLNAHLDYSMAPIANSSVVDYAPPYTRARIISVPFFLPEIPAPRGIPATSAAGGDLPKRLKSAIVRAVRDSQQIIPPATTRASVHNIGRPVGTQSTIRHHCAS